MKIRAWVVSSCVLLFCGVGLGAQTPPVIAIVPFTVSGEKAVLARYANVGKGVAEMLATDLPDICDCQIVERIKLKNTLDEHDLQIAFSKSGDAVKAGKLVRASHVAVGAIAVAGDSLRIDVRLVETDSGKLAATAKCTVAASDLFSAASDLAFQIAAPLGRKARPPRPTVEGTTPQLRAYLDALALSDKKDYEAARLRLAGEMSNNASGRYFKAALIPALYNAALYETSQSRFVKARLILSDLVATYPKHSLAADARKLLKDVDQKIPLKQGLKAVSGLITENTIWPRARSPIIITSDTKVTKGVTLAIESGTEVHFVNNARLWVDGRLLAIGSALRPIKFLPAPVPTTGPLPKYWKRAEWAALYFTGDTLRMEHCHTERAGVQMSAEKGTGVVVNCRFGKASPLPDWFRGSNMGVTRSGFHITKGQCVVSHCTFSDRRSGLCVGEKASTTLTRLTFVRCSLGATIALYRPRGLRGDKRKYDPIRTITESVFLDCQYALRAAERVQRCAFIGGHPVPEAWPPHASIKLNGSYGVRGEVLDCLFQDSPRGVIGNDVATVRGCNFVNITLFASVGSGDVRNNWWGTTDATEIRRLIPDPKLDAIKYVPVATTPFKLDIPGLAECLRLRKTGPDGKPTGPPNLKPDRFAPRRRVDPPSGN